MGYFGLKSMSELNFWHQAVLPVYRRVFALRPMATSGYLWLDMRNQRGFIRN